MNIIEIVGTTLYVVLLGIVTGGYVAAAWSPFLLLSSIRPLFRIGPSDDWITNYLIGMTGIGIVHIAVVVAGTLLIGTAFAPLEILFYSGVGVAVFAMAFCGTVLPALGHNWTESEDWFVSSLSLLGGGIWYAGITIIPPFILWTMYLARFQP